MSTPEKLRNQGQRAASELTKLKEVWRRMADDARAYWLERFVSAELSQAQIRQEIFTKLKINLRFDSKLNAFRAWVAAQAALDDEAEQMQDDERRLAEEHPEWTKEQVREDVLKRAYLRARSHGDFKLGLKTIAADAKLESLQFDRDKFKESLRTKIQAGLDQILAEADNNPVIKAAVEQIQKATAKE